MPGVLLQLSTEAFALRAEIEGDDDGEDGQEIVAGDTAGDGQVGKYNGEDQRHNTFDAEKIAQTFNQSGRHGDPSLFRMILLHDMRPAPKRPRRGNRTGALPLNWKGSPVLPEPVQRGENAFERTRKARLPGSGA